MSVGTPLSGTTRPTYTTRQRQGGSGRVRTGNSRVSTPRGTRAASGNFHRPCSAIDWAIMRLATLTVAPSKLGRRVHNPRSEEHTSELQSQFHLVCRLL